MSQTPPQDEDRPNTPSRPELEQGAISDESMTKVHAQLLREKEEPVEGYSPMPIFLLFIFSALIFFSGVYLAKFSGGFDPLVYDERMTFLRGQGPDTGPAAPIDPIVLGRRLYTQQCVACHQTSGMGVAGVFPPLVGSSWVIDHEERLIRVLLQGLVGPIEVLGNQYNGNMPGFGSMWNNEQIAAVLTFIRQEWGNNAPAISPEEVSAVRSATAGRTRAWTAEELRPYLN